MLLGCAGLFEHPIPLQQEPTPEAIEAARALAAHVVDGRFPSTLAEDCEANGASFVWLAARAEDPEVIAAGLLAAAGCAGDDAGSGDLPMVAAARLGEPGPVRIAALSRPPSPSCPRSPRGTRW
ncbi:MAG: hypothetical protein R3F59_08910 [Myxococcota bacterium]